MVINSDIALLKELEPFAEEALNKHIKAAKPWHPHTFVPWSRGEDFEEGYVWDPTESSVSEEVRSALYVNLLTEDNLPYYFRDIERMFGKDGIWGEWVRRWTAEECRHATAIRDYLTVTRTIDPAHLEEGRMAQMSGGKVPEPETATDGLVYVTLQELATRISHRNTGSLIEDKAGYDVMRRVAMDENLHFIFYRDMAKAALDIDPSQVVLSMEKEIKGFAMPGEGIPQFHEHAKIIANAGIYNLSVHFDHIIKPVVIEFWGLPNLTGLSGEAQKAQESTMAYIEKSKRVADRLKEKMLAAKES